MMMKKIVVKLKNKSYPIFFKKNLLQEDFIIDYCMQISRSIVIITHKNIENLFAKKLFEKFLSKNIKVQLLKFEDKEINKNRQTKEYLEDEMLKENFLKDSLIISIGGGIVSDISGFIAATYMRGISYVIIPTTLLSMVDASIGGKTAINTKWGKNTIGVIYHPKAVFIDIDVLKTLSDEEMKNGLIEMLKHTLIFKKNSFYKLLNSNDVTLDLIIDSINIKRKIVQKDENDKNLRKILNFGHTISHAIEASSDYEISHGKALCLGILIESYLSYKMKLLSKKEFDEIYFFLKTKNLLFEINNLSKEKILNFIKRDKKNILGKNSFTLLKYIGKSTNNVEIIEKDILQSLDFLVGGKLC